MGDQGNKDFIVNSKGRCFICLDKVEPDLETGCSSRCYTLQCISRYLKMDLTKVFHQKGFIPPSLVAQVKRSTLKAELCEDCAKLTKSFSQLYQQSKKLEMEMDLKLAHIQQKLMKTEELGRVWKSEEDKGLIEVVQVLRAEAMEKCSSRIENIQPRVRVLKLSRQEVNACLRTTSSDKKTEKPMDSTTFVFNPNNDVKMENPTENVLMNDDNDIGNDFNDDVGERSEDDSMCGATQAMMIDEVKTASTTDSSVDNNKEVQQTGRVAEGAHVIASSPFTSETLMVERMYTIDPKTRKYRCKLCSKEFVQAGFKYHYESIHLKIRYKCNLCGKEFSQKPSYNRHLRTAHLGVRFQCFVCNEQFKQKTHLQNHQRKNSCMASKKANSEFSTTK